MQQVLLLNVGSVVSVRVLDSLEDYEASIAALKQGHGPLAIDAERASGYTYSQRAFLIQIHRRESGTFLFDAPAIGNFSQLFSYFSKEEWVLHSASQDLPCLREVGISPQQIFDTELSARLLGMEKVGLGAVVEQVLGLHLEKEHSAADWSTRPLPQSWLKYAALDVEHLIDVRDYLEMRLKETGKHDWALQEFQSVLDKKDKPAVAEPWRRLSGLHTLKSSRQMAIARSLWNKRDEIARHSDTAPGRIIPDSSIIAVSKHDLTHKGELRKLKEFHGRASTKFLDQWWQAYEEGCTTEDLPVKKVNNDSIPAPRLWADKKPEAHARLLLAKESLSVIAQNENLPLENLLTPSLLRELAWSPPEQITVVTIKKSLDSLGARPWQIGLTCAAIANSFVEAQQNFSDKTE